MVDKCPLLTYNNPCSGLTSRIFIPPHTALWEIHRDFLYERKRL